MKLYTQNLSRVLGCIFFYLYPPVHLSLTIVLFSLENTICKGNWGNGGTGGYEEGQL